MNWVHLCSLKEILLCYSTKKSNFVRPTRTKLCKLFAIRLTVRCMLGWWTCSCRAQLRLMRRNDFVCFQVCWTPAAGTNSMRSPDFVADRYISGGHSDAWNIQRWRSHIFTKEEDLDAIASIRHRKCIHSSFCSHFLTLLRWYMCLARESMHSYQNYY